MKKLRWSLIVCVVAISGMSAQTLADAIKLTRNEQYESADAIFKKLIQAQPNNGDLYFYYGENFFKNENLSMANEMYQTGADVNPTNALPYVGLGKVLWYKGKQTEAKASFYKATTLSNNKNATVLLKIAETYINADKKSLPDAFTLLATATKLESKNPEVYLLTGDAYLEQNDGTKAIENYEKAASLDPKSVLAILRQGQLYNRAKNFTLALEKYKAASLIDSSFAPAYREKAEIYFRAGQYANAVGQYKRYLQLNDNCGARGRYAGFLYKAKQYPASIEAANEAKKCDPNNIYLDRYIAYSSYETGDYANGMALSKSFFSKASPDKIIAQDYEYRGKLYAKTGADSLAIPDYKKAIEMDSSKSELSNDMANAYMKMKKYGDAIAMFNAKVAAGKAGVNDYYGLGRAYYYSKDFANADSSFSKIVAAQPDLALGYLWKAKAAVQTDLDNKNWKAKELYETFISKVKPEETERSKKDLIDAYKYLAAYYAKKNDCTNTKSYMEKVLALDPANAEAKKIIAGLKC
ncbi:MAG TPA: tetratricopeptide repeat protein [Bacteroidia bacterium]|jgi:tetratricopeptide (TPR) repeat protein|nr:tetratricopeptide repeat protein [Bacteroidia bacterium]